MAEATSETTKKVGNPICESCEEDRKNISVNAARVMREENECYPLYQKVEECGKVSGHRVQACFKEWREFASCKRNWIAKERGIVYNRPKAPEKWLEKHPGSQFLGLVKCYCTPLHTQCLSTCISLYTQSFKTYIKTARGNLHPMLAAIGILDTTTITTNDASIWNIKVCVASCSVVLCFIR